MTWCCKLCHNKLTCNMMRHYNLKISIYFCYLLRQLTKENLEKVSRWQETKKKMVAFFYHKMHLYFGIKAPKAKKVCKKIQLNYECAMAAASIDLHCFGWIPQKIILKPCSLFEPNTMFSFWTIQKLPYGAVNARSMSKTIQVILKTYKEHKYGRSDLR